MAIFGKRYKLPPLSGIILVSGLPGAGKTLYTIAAIDAAEDLKGRTKYYLAKDNVDDRAAGIAGLELPDWMPFKNYQDWFALPEGSVIVMDECQYILPKRGPGTPPDWVAVFAEFRKRGYTIFLITQDVRNIDFFVRRLAGTHIHYHRPFGLHKSNRYVYDHAIEDDLRSASVQKQAFLVQRLVPHPTQYYDKYASATVHVVKASIPVKLWFFVVVGLFSVFLVWRVFAGFGDNAKDAAKVEESKSLKEDKRPVEQPQQSKLVERPALEPAVKIMHRYPTVTDMGPEYLETLPGRVSGIFLTPAGGTAFLEFCGGRKLTLSIAQCRLSDRWYCFVGGVEYPQVSKSFLDANCSGARRGTALAAQDVFSK